MSRKVLKITTVSGSLQQPSRTDALLAAIVGELASALPIQISQVRLSEIGPQVGSAMHRAALPPAAFAAVSAIEEADALIVASPVYRGSYTGLLKHLFDFVGSEALTGKPVLLAASAGSARHTLMIDHQLRPLFAFFQALTLPVGVLATEADFEDYTLTSPAIKQAISHSIDAALPWLKQRLNTTSGAIRQPFFAQL